jgi:alcohol dehydrogenase
MIANFLVQPRLFEQRDIPAPDRPQADDVLVRVHRVGICGTDIAGYLGKFPFYSYPRIPGHELGIEVVEVGSNVSHVKADDRCSVEPYINNPNSFASRRGRSNCCNELKVLGVHIDGGMRSHFVVPGRKLHRSASLTFDQLALVETLAIGCHAIDRASPEPGEHMLVIGAGPIGLSTIVFARLAGVELTVMDVNQQRLEFCQRVMGVPHIIELSNDVDELARLTDITNGHLPTIVIDATGNRNSMSQSFRYAAHTGKVVFLGITQEEVSFQHPLLHARELTLLTSRNALPKDFTRIIQLIENGSIDTRPWITHRTSFDDVIHEFEAYTKPETGVIKAIVELDGVS